MMAKQTIKSKTESTDETADCRVVEIGIGNFAECAQWGPIQCEHAMPLGGSFLCLHPRLDNIIENTKKALSTEKL
jgi:hypothetical protein